MARKTKRGPLPETPQRFSWKTAGTFPTFGEADAARNARGGNAKVQLRGDGTYAVKVGTPVKKTVAEPAGEVATESA